MPVRGRHGVASVSFAFPGAAGSITLRDPKTDRFVSDTPEWSDGVAHAAAAYVGGSRPSVRVVLSGTPRSKTRGWLGAAGAGGPGVRAARRTFVFDARGRSRPVELELAAPLPGGIGSWTITWHWTLRLESGVTALGTTRHEVLTTWKAPLPPSDWLPLGSPIAAGKAWIYEPIARWTCAWARGRRTAKGICDAIIASLRLSGLRYSVSAHDVRDVLLRGGGMCGGWYKTYQAMAGAQGVFVSRRCFLVDWRPLRDEEARWCAIVVTHRGLGWRAPPVPAWDYHDVEEAPMRTAPVRVRPRLHRYTFWGAPGLRGDGHCVNFLQYKGRRFLYDASFNDRPVALGRFRLPTTVPKRSIPVSRLGRFRRAYLDAAVAYMLGSVRRPDGFYQTRIPGTGEPASSKKIRPGLSVRTSTVNASDDGITFYWGP